MAAWLGSLRSASAAWQIQVNVQRRIGQHLLEDFFQ